MSARLNVVALVIAAGVSGVAGCAGHAPAIGSGPLPPIPPLALSRPDVDLGLPPGRPRQINSRWLFGDEFFPPGAKRIYPEPRVEPKLRETPQIKYPSMEVLPSPDGALTIFSDSGEAKNVMVHWLMVYRKGEARPASLYHTRNTFEVLWGADSVHAAITEFIGDNRSEVLIGDMRDYSRTGPLDLSAAASKYFDVDQLAAPRFVRAHAFGDGPLLLVRCVGRLPTAPFDQFGYEVLVDLAHLDDPSTLTFVRGYVLPGHQVDQ
jgi:hypothetical protein